MRPADTQRCYLCDDTPAPRTALLDQKVCQTCWDWFCDLWPQVVRKGANQYA